MAEVEHTTTSNQPVERIWDFVREIDNWAPLVTGYQSHEKQNEDDSSWVLKGDLGSLTRTLKFKVHVSEWAGPERVIFELEGINEQMTGNGVFEMSRAGGADGGGEAESAVPVAPATPGPLRRLWAAIVRFFMYKVMSRPEPATPGAETPASGGDGTAELRFYLQINPGGPMGPMINAMVKPALIVAAEDLAGQIVAKVEEQAAA